MKVPVRSGVGFESRWDHHIGSLRSPAKKHSAELPVLCLDFFPFAGYSVDKDLLTGVPVIPDVLAIVPLDHPGREPHRSTIRLLLHQS
jgi:hypothetical protein